MQMGRVEELGSGVLNVNKYLPFYAKGMKPRFVEGDPFVTTIPLPDNVTHGEWGGEKGGEKGGENLTDNQVKILDMIRKNGFISARELAAKIGITPRKIEQNISKLKLQNHLRRIGPDKGGHWEVAKGL